MQPGKSVRKIAAVCQHYGLYKTDYYIPEQVWTHINSTLNLILPILAKQQQIECELNFII